MTSQIAFLVDVADYSPTDLPTFVKQAEDVRLLVARQLPGTPNLSVQVNRVITGTRDLFDTKTVLALVAGGAAGAHTVTGIKTTSTLEHVYILEQDPAPTVASTASASGAGHVNFSGAVVGSVVKSVVGVKTADQTVHDFTAEFQANPAGAGFLDNTSGTTTSGYVLIATFTLVPDTTALTDTKSEYTVTANTVTNTGGTSSAGQQLLVEYRN